MLQRGLLSFQTTYRDQFAWARRRSNLIHAALEINSVGERNSQKKRSSVHVLSWSCKKSVSSLPFLPPPSKHNNASSTFLFLSFSKPQTNHHSQRQREREEQGNSAVNKEITASVCRLQSWNILHIQASWTKAQHCAVHFKRRNNPNLPMLMFTFAEWRNQV